MVEHGDGRQDLGAFAAAQGASGRSREESFMEPDIGRILIFELFRERIDADTSQAKRGIGFEQRAVVTTDVDDDIACLQGKTLLHPGGHPSQVLAHRGIGTRLVAVVEGVHFSRRHRMQQLHKLTIRAAHQSERRQRRGRPRPPWETGWREPAPRNPGPAGDRCSRRSDRLRFSCTPKASAHPRRSPANRQNACCPSPQVTS